MRSDRLSETAQDAYTLVLEMSRPEPNIQIAISIVENCERARDAAAREIDLEAVVRAMGGRFSCVSTSSTPLMRRAALGSMRTMRPFPIVEVTTLP